ncbi:hypothetical protein QBC39DRAFT_370533 [Podospora conica]|nr:hypothetical protein QBC39DRAFT_370533 [Schizothecium conicum]
MKLTLLAAAALVAPILATPTPATSPALDKRATVFTSLNCKRVKGHGDYGVIVNQGLTNLMFKAGKPSIAAGKTGTPLCARVFCDADSNSGIFWCNSNTKALTLATYNDIADGVLRIATDQTCLTNSLANVNNGQRLSGQAFYKEGYNVIVGSC